MIISDIALKRPVASIVLSLIIILMGVVGFNFLGVRLYPAIDPPIITVQTSYSGANSEIIESQFSFLMQFWNLFFAESIKKLNFAYCKK